MLLPIRLLAATFVTLLLAVGFACAAPPGPAAAATMNAGIADLTPDGFYLGNYLAPDSTRVYCIDSPLPWPSGDTSGPSLATSIVTTWGDPLSSAAMQSLNYVLLKYGQTDDPVQAAAVAAFVKAYTSAQARDLGAGFDAGAWYINGNPAVLATYDGIWADAQANAAPAGAATLRIDMTDSASGTLVVAASTVDAVGTVVLDGAVRSDDGATEFAVDGDERVAVRGRPADDVPEYAISAAAQFTAPTPAAANLTLYVTDGQQRTISGGTTGSVPFEASTSTEAIPLDFAPTLSTTVASEIVAVGDPFVDRVTVGLAPDSRPWRLLGDGAAAPIVADGVLYGPFDTAPTTSAAIPAGAPVAGTERITVSGVGEYESAGGVVASKPGYYTWVWRIEGAQQDAVGLASLPPGYSFVSQFGIPGETHRVPVPAARLAATGSEARGAAVAGIGLIASGILAVIRGRRLRHGNNDGADALAVT